MDFIWASQMFSDSKAAWSKLPQFIRNGLIILDFKTEADRIPSFCLLLGSLIFLENIITFLQRGMVYIQRQYFSGHKGLLFTLSTAVIAKLTYICIMKRGWSYMAQNNEIGFEVIFCLTWTEEHQAAFKYPLLSLQSHLARCLLTWAHYSTKMQASSSNFVFNDILFNECM